MCWQSFHVGRKEWILSNDKTALYGHVSPRVVKICATILGNIIAIQKTRFKHVCEQFTAVFIL